VAERVGFEPTLEFPLNTLSKRAPSTTRPSLRTVRQLLEFIILGAFFSRRRRQRVVAVRVLRRTNETVYLAAPRDV